MKKIVLFLLLFILGFSLVRAQVRPIVVDWKLWTTVDDYYYNIYGEPYTPETYFVKFEGDTVIVGLNYLKIMKSIDVDTIDFTCVGYARQTSDSKKVFFRNLESAEGCVYDFSVSQGDTITDLYNPLREYLFYDDFDVVVDSVYFVNINDSSYRALDIMRIGYPDSKETIIEGIGSECGILEVGHAFSGVIGWSLSLLCYWENDELCYHTDSYDFCFYDDLSVVNLENAEDINIFPNPTKDILNITSENIIVKVEIIDVNGRMLFSKKTTVLSLRELKLKSGVYFLQITTNNSMLFKKIILK
jgi:hypothetical protein